MKFNVVERTERKLSIYDVVCMYEVSLHIVSGVITQRFNGIVIEEQGEYSM
jgi:hypothetical protein